MKPRILIRPLKAPVEPILDLATLQDFLPLLASDKEDGIRCMICPKRGPISGQMKPIPNRWINRLLNLKSAVYLDGEIVALDCEGNTCDFNDTQSAVMSREGQPDFEFRVFDWYGNIYSPYWERMGTAMTAVAYLKGEGMGQFAWLHQTKCTTVAALQVTEHKALALGKEGIMLRNPEGWYKEGRSTLSEAYLLKVKRFTDDEAFVIDIEPEYENCNTATRDERGLQKRSKHKANLKQKDRVGKLVCRWNTFNDKDELVAYTIKIGSGMTDFQKQLWWKHPELILKKFVTFKYQLHGMKVLPRAPIFKSIRDPRA